MYEKYIHTHAHSQTSDEYKRIINDWSSIIGLKMSIIDRFILDREERMIDYFNKKSNFIE